MKKFIFQGGLKAAITSDVIQGITMIGVSIMIIIHGTVDVGGVSTVFNVTKQHGRLDFFKYVFALSLLENRNGTVYK